MSIEGLIKKFQRYLSVQVFSVTVFLIGLVSGIVEIFELSRCHRCLGLTVSALVGGVIILVIHLWHNHSDPQDHDYKLWDIILAIMLFICIEGGLVFLTIDRCAVNKCPTVGLTVSSHTIVEGETVNLSATAKDNENDPLVYFWYSREVNSLSEVDIPGLGVQSGRPLNVTETTYTAPVGSSGKTIKIIFSATDPACGRDASASQQIYVLDKASTPTDNIYIATGETISETNEIIAVTATATATTEARATATTEGTPTHTYTYTPIPTGTPTSTLTPSSTPSHTPTATPTNTPTPIPPTSTPTSTPMPPTPTPTPTRILIKLHEPPLDAEINVNQIHFRWEWMGAPLASNEDFALRMWREDSPSQERHSITWTNQKDEYILTLDNPPVDEIEFGPGLYYWNVAWVREYCPNHDDPDCWEALYESEPRRLYLGGVPTPTATPPPPPPTKTPIPTDTPEPTP